MTIEWTPLRSYAGFEHVLGAGACFVHPGNGNVYWWACEKKAGTRQNLTIYRLVAKTGAWEETQAFLGTVDAVSFIERGGCVIDHTGALQVGTSLDPKDGKTITGTGFEGVRTRIEKVDDPYLLQGELLAMIEGMRATMSQLQSTLAALPLTVTGPTIRVPASGPVEGGEIQLASGDGGPPWCIDVYAGVLRLHRAGKVVAQWTG